MQTSLTDLQELQEENLLSEYDDPMSLASRLLPLVSRLLSHSHPRMTEITTNSILTRLETYASGQTSIGTEPECTEIALGATQAIADATLHSDSQSQSELRRSIRSHTRTRRAKEGGYDTKLATDKQRTQRAAHTRARNKKNKSSNIHSDTESVGLESSTFASEAHNDSRDPSPSPTPITTAAGPEAQTIRGYLKDRLSHKFQDVLDHSGTQTLIEVDEAISSDPAHSVQPQEHCVEAQFLPPVMVGVGGGFHLDHPTHRPGNTKTYRGTRGDLPTTLMSNPPSQVGSTEPESDLDNNQRYAIQPFTPQEHGLHAPLPIRDPNCPFLAYPDEEGSCTPHSIVSDNAMGPQPLVNQSPTGPPPRERVSHPPTRTERSLTHISTSSKSLGDPIPFPPPASASNEVRSARRSGILAPPHGSTPDPSMLGLTPSEPEGRVQQKARSHSQGKRPRETPESPLPARKRPMTHTRSTRGGKVYTGRLNIVEINSERVSNTGLPSQQALRRRRSASQPQRRSTSNTSAGNRTTPASEQSGDDDFDMLGDFDEDQHVVDSALKGVLVKPDHRKPTAHDLPVLERAFWKDVRDTTWALSMGQGNFQTRGVYATWAEACFSELIQQRLPDLDEDTPMSDNMRTVVLNNLCNARHQDVVRLRPAVQDYFKLKNPSTPEGRQTNKDKVTEMYPDWFHCKDPANYTDPYEGGIMPVALESLLFYGPKAIGARYPGLIVRNKDPVDERKHLAVLAYVSTMVQFCLSEWTKGYFDKGKLNATQLQCVWVCHFDGLKNVSLVARKRLIRTYNKWIQSAYDASQAPKKFSRRSYVQAVVRTKDVRPDTRASTPIDQD